MLKLIAGKKGSGKTKQLISMVNETAVKSNGKVVCLEKGSSLTYDVDHSVRLLDTEEYDVSGYDSLYGFLAGIAASDFDVKDIFVDSLLRIAGDDLGQISKLLLKLDKLFTASGISAVMTVSVEPSELTSDVAKFIK